jgi:hypothetical protein
MHSTIRSFVVAVFVAVVAVAAWLSSARAEEAPPQLAHDIGSYALYGRSYVKWTGAAAMPLRAKTGSDALVEFGAFVDASGDESFVAAPSLVARAATKRHAVFSDTVDVSVDVEIAHDVAPFAAPLIAATDWPRLPAVSCGGPDITVDATSSPLRLTPGRYGVVTVLQDQTLELEAGGRYELCSLRVRSGATVEAHTGTFVLLRDFVTTAARARLTGCGARWIALGQTASPAPASAGFDFGQGTGTQNRARIEGQFFTPGRITMAQHNDYVGRFWADRIDGLAAEPVTRTLGDCRSPQCGDGVVDAGEACDDGNNLDGDCCSSFCELLPEGSDCNDGRFCTTVDRCDDAGVCGGSGDPCDAPDGDANCSESCNEDSDSCDAPDPDATACDDGVWCNGEDLCASGLCVAHAGSPCPGPDNDANCHESCDEASRSCTAQDGSGAPCDDGRFCTVGERCDAAGSCAGGASPCPAGDGDGNCAESCDELADACTAFDAEGAACDDGLFCTASDLCDGRGVCNGWGDPCTTSAGDANCSGACNEADDSCSLPEIDGSPCSDGLACTLGERCIGGTCSPGGQTSCDDGNPCTDEFCAPDGSCLRSWNASPCDDGNACTTGDRCNAGACEGTAEIDCRDDDLCSRDVCDPADGSCRHSYAPAESCHEDGNGRTQIELGYSPKDGELAERLTTTWRGTSEVDFTRREELGDPSAGDPFAVCFYDESGGLPRLAYRLDFDASTAGGAVWRKSWRASDVVYKLKADGGTEQGVSQLRLLVDKDGTPVFKLKAGANVGCTSECRSKFRPPSATGDGRMFMMEPGMTVQWVASTGACWSSRYAGASVNTQQSFAARAKPLP